MQRRTLLAGLAGALGPAPARAGATGPVVVELFTSQGCSSCPPADVFLSELARSRPDVLALSFHVTYWNGLGWPDPFSLPAATSRQRRIAALLAAEVYTPQIVINGAAEMVGSDRPHVLAAIALALEARRVGPALAVTRQDSQAIITVGAGEGVGDIVLLGTDGEHRTLVGSGENAGRVLREFEHCALARHRWHLARADIADRPAVAAGRAPRGAAAGAAGTGAGGCAGGLITSRGCLARRPGQAMAGHRRGSTGGVQLRAADGHGRNRVPGTAVRTTVRLAHQLSARVACCGSIASTNPPISEGKWLKRRNVAIDDATIILG